MREQALSDCLNLSTIQAASHVVLPADCAAKAGPRSDAILDLLEFGKHVTAHGNADKSKGNLAFVVFAACEELVNRAGAALYGEAIGLIEYALGILNIGEESLNWRGQVPLSEDSINTLGSRLTDILGRGGLDVLDVAA